MGNLTLFKDKHDLGGSRAAPRFQNLFNSLRLHLVYMNPLEKLGFPCSSQIWHKF